MSNLPTVQRLLALFLWLSALVFVSAEYRTAADILPATTVAFAEIRQPAALMDTVYDHKITQRIQTLDQVRAAMEKKEYLDYKAGVAVVESQMGMPWRKIIEQTMGGGIAIAVDAQTQYIRWTHGVPTAVPESNLVAGDRVSVKIRADRRASLNQVESTPAKVVSDSGPPNGRWRSNEPRTPTSGRGRRTRRQ